jgi:hypothetical protein
MSGTVVYEDVVRRTDAGWRIARRTVIPRRRPLHPGEHRTSTADIRVRVRPSANAAALATCATRDARLLGFVARR